jgi:hypothetical protein
MVGASVVLGACALTPARPAAMPSPLPPLPSITQVQAVNPDLCKASGPAEQTPFAYNQDAASRDRLVNAQLPYLGGIASFYDLDVHHLATLIEEHHIDPHERHNAAPTVWEIFTFMCGHPTVRASGYVVSLDRPDYRTSIDDVAAPSIDAALRADARQLCADAQTTFDGHLECFWD